MTIEYSRTQLEEIFAGETLSPAARLLLAALIERAIPAPSKLEKFVEEVRQTYKNMGLISALKRVRCAALNPEMVEHLRGYTADPTGLFGAKMIVEKIMDGIPPDPLCTLLEGEET